MPITTTDKTEKTDPDLRSEARKLASELPAPQNQVMR